MPHRKTSYWEWKPRRRTVDRVGSFMEEVTFEFGLEEKVGSDRQRRGATAPTLEQREEPAHTDMRPRKLAILRDRA